MPVDDSRDIVSEYLLVGVNRDCHRAVSQSGLELLFVLAANLPVVFDLNATHAGLKLASFLLADHVGVIILLHQRIDPSICISIVNEATFASEVAPGSIGRAVDQLLW